MKNLELEPKTTALVLIDLQHSTVARRLAPHTSADVVKNAAQLANAVSAKGGTVTFVRVTS